MNIQKAREERRIFYVGENKEYGTFSIAPTEASAHCMDNFTSVDGTPTRYPGNTNAVFESNRNRMARSARFQGGNHHRLRASGCDKRHTVNE